MGQPLFDKTYDELREAFVRARFAEPAVFGRENIEAWLEAYKPGQPIEGAEPWQCPLFLQTVDAEYRSRDIAWGAFLADAATPVDRVPNDLFDGVSRLIAGNVTRSMGKRLYCAHSPHQLMILGGHSQVYTMTCVASGSIMIRPTTSLDVLWILHEEIVRAQPQATSALGFMKEHLARVIDRERESAKRDFDGAVAVSADGTKIVHTSWVFVGEGKSPTSGLLFPASAFRQNKILCGTTIAHANVERWQLEQISYNRNELSLDRFLSSMLVGWGRSWVVNGVACLVSDTVCRDIMRPGETVLFVDKNTCPSPLPDGGREIRV